MSALIIISVHSDNVTIITITPIMKRTVIDLPACWETLKNPVLKTEGKKRMVPITQTVLSNPEKGIIGNCQYAAISSITEIPLKEFAGIEHLTGGKWFIPLVDILNKYNFEYMGTLNNKEDILNYKDGVDGYYVVCGGSPRGFKSGHAVVFHNGAMVHDPHPEGTGITDITHALMIERNIGE